MTSQVPTIISGQAAPSSQAKPLVPLRGIQHEKIQHEKLELQHPAGSVFQAH